MKKLQTVVAIALAMTLSACGGGGGSSAPAPVVTPTAPVVTPAPTVVLGDLQKSGTGNYSVGSQELAFFSALNVFRGYTGLGLLNQNTKLDKSSSNHLAYILGNADVNFSALDASGTPLFHSEDPARPGFTGRTLADRTKFAQYGSIYVGEEGGYGNGAGAAVALQQLIATVYHRAGLMLQSPREIGLAVGTDVAQTMVINYGYETKLQYNASDFFGSYPTDKQTGIPLSMYIEAPNPFPGLAYADFASKTSYPINVVSEASTTLAVTSFTVTEAGATAPLSVYQLNASTSAQDKQFLGTNAAYIVGKAPFKPNTTYNVSFSGTVNGAAVTKNWSFTTGN